jgi:hypothetical protein
MTFSALPDTGVEMFLVVSDLPNIGVGYDNRNQHQTDRSREAV